MIKSGQETRQRMARGKPEEQAGDCDILGRLSGAGVGTACQTWGSNMEGARSPRPS